jgi:hypothetical protein
LPCAPMDPENDEGGYARSADVDIASDDLFPGLVAAGHLCLRAHELCRKRL